MPRHPDIIELANKVDFAIDGHSMDWEVLFAARVLMAGLSHVVNERWESDAETLDGLPFDVELSRESRDSRDAIVRASECVARLHLEGGQLDVKAVGPSPEVARAAIATIRKALPKRKRITSGPKLPFSFWTESRYVGGGEREDHVLEAPSWSEVEANYAATARELLQTLMSVGPPSEIEGRMILWHGPPGTGKTYALRALARAWRRWCDVHVVADPERFLQDKSYMDEVIGETRSEERWRLVALEDTGELLTADARERVGHGLSRLLNATDGLLGQATKFLVLITTNEPIGRLHPAVARPGRCLADVEFALLSVAEANAWLAACSKERVSCATPIADLYELVSERRLIHTHASVRPRVGFAANGNAAN